MKIKNKNKKTKLLNIKTGHGKIRIPNFLFCGTKAAIKGGFFSRIKLEVLMTNTFHLWDYADLIESSGGIHKFINFKKPIFTDSGGFQVFSLKHGSVFDEIKRISKGNILNKKIENYKIKISEKGINFGKKILTPELSIEIQSKIGSDFVLCLDECTPFNESKEYTENSMRRTMRWHEIGIEKFKEVKKEHQLLYGILQGGVYKDLRDENINFFVKNKNNFFGIAIGGSLGKEKKDMYNLVKYLSEKIRTLLPNKPIHLLGIGDMESIVELYEYVDTFDCVHPTRIGRHGIALSLVNDDLSIKKSINLNKAIYKNDFNVIDEKCNCFTCKNHTKAYLHFLLKTKEINGYSLIVTHNIYVMQDLMKKLQKLKEKEF